MPKKPQLLAVTYLDDLDANGRTPVNFNQGSMNPTPKFKGVSIPQGRNQGETAKSLLNAAQKAVGEGVKLAVGYEDENLTRQVMYLYDTARFVNEKIEKEEFAGYGTFWVFKEKVPVAANNS